MTDRLMGDEELVILVDEDGGEHEFYLVDTMEVEGNRYAILLPSEEDEEDEGEVIILKIGKDQDGSEVYYEIEDDEEWEKVADAWEEAAIEDETEAGGKVLSPGLPVTVNASNSDKKCPACNTALKEGTKATACPACKTVHHKECWQEGGCANDGCEG
ncbi:MAG: DUF1292 domain-containing protein [Firmicutes bacterium]|nr:DUF1292 domain-containing protein [Bacillota bacterium]